MRLFLGDADFRQVLDQNFRFDLEFPGQLINSYLIRICHQPLLLLALISTSVCFVPSPLLLPRPQSNCVAFLLRAVPGCPQCRVNPTDPCRARCLFQVLPELPQLQASPTIPVPRLLRAFQMLRRHRGYLAPQRPAPAALRLPQPVRPVRQRPALPAFQNMLPPTGESFQPSSRQCPEFPLAVPASYPRVSPPK